MKENIDILKSYRIWLELRQIKSIDDYLRTVAEFLLWLSDNNLDYQSVTETEIISYRNTLINSRKLQVPTIINQINRIRSFYTFLVKKNMAVLNPADSIPGLKVPSTLPKNILSLKEMETLLSEFSILTPNDLLIKSVVELLYGSSLRVGEAESIKLEDIDFQASMVRVINLKSRGQYKKVPLTENAIYEIKRYITQVRSLLISSADSEYLYPQKGEGWLRGLVNRKLTNECRRLGLKKITSHCFRHSSATHCLKAGASLPQVQTLLGHSRIRNTEIYTRIVKDDLKEVVFKYHPREASNEL